MYAPAARFNDIRVCGMDEEGPARRHATRHDQLVIWPSLFEQRWSISGGRRGKMELRIAGLSKTYTNGVKAVDQVSLSVPRSIDRLFGQNGTGKSTLMRTIATLHDAVRQRLG